MDKDLQRQVKNLLGYAQKDMADGKYAIASSWITDAIKRLESGTVSETNSAEDDYTDLFIAPQAPAVETNMDDTDNYTQEAPAQIDREEAEIF